MIRIGVDGGCWANRRGYGRFLRELLPAILREAPGDEIVFFLERQSVGELGRLAGEMTVVPVDCRVAPSRAAAADGYRGPLDLLRFTREVSRARPDVFFFPSVYSYFPLPPSLPAVVGIHDAIADRHPQLTLASTRARWFWRLKVWLALRQADLVLTVSDYAARELGDVLGVDAARLRVCTEAPAAAYRPSKSTAEQTRAAGDVGVPPGVGYFTYVGGFNPHKRVDVAVRAHARVVRRMGPEAPHLVLVGSLDDDVFHGNLSEIREAVRSCGTGDLVHWPGFVPDEKLRHLHSGALAVLLPSQSEGFGLPAVEAAACGCPCIATRESPLPSLLVGGGIFVAPGDEAGLAEAMRRLVEEPEERNKMGERARERAAGLSWRASARSVLAALREAAGTAKGRGERGSALPADRSRR